jgi:MFS family permease
MTVIAAGIWLALPRFIANIAKNDGAAQKTATGKTKEELAPLPQRLRHIAIIASFAVLFADGARTTFFPVLMDGFGYSATVIGFFLSLRAFVSMSVRAFMGRFIKLVGGRFPALIIAIFIMGLGIGITPFCRGYLSLTLNAALVGIGLGLALPLSMATVSEGVPPEDRGVAMGIRLTGNRLAQLVKPHLLRPPGPTSGLLPVLHRRRRGPVPLRRAHPDLVARQGRGTRM